MQGQALPYHVTICCKISEVLTVNDGGSMLYILVESFIGTGFSFLVI